MTATSTGFQARERSLAHYIDLLRRNWLFVLVPAIVAGLVGGYFALGDTDEFRSRAVVRVGDPSLPSGLFDTRNSNELDELLATSIEIISSEPIRDEVLSSVGVSSAAAFSDVDIRRIDETVLVEVVVLATERDAATEIAQAWADTYVEREVSRSVGVLNERAAELQTQIVSIETSLAEVNAAIAAEAAALSEQQSEPVVITGNETPVLAGLTQQRNDLLDEQSRLRQRANEFEVEAALRSGVVEVAFPASRASGPIGSGAVRTAVVAGFLGLLLGAGLAIARDELDDRIRTIEDLEAAVAPAPILATVPGPISRRSSAGLPVLDHDDPRSESYRALRTNFEFIASQHSDKAGGRIVMVTSATNSDGKSTTASNLAAALGTIGRSVVIVDADLRRGFLHDQFGARPGPGLIDVLVHDLPVDEALQHADLPGGEHVFLLAGGRHPSPAELFSAKAFDRLMHDLSHLADYVILDAPPILPVSDALALGRRADEVVVIASAGRTRLPQLRSTVDAIRRLDLSILGFVLNGVSRSSKGYYDYSDDRPKRVSRPGRRAVDLPPRDPSVPDASARLRGDDGPSRPEPRANALAADTRNEADADPAR